MFTHYFRPSLEKKLFKLAKRNPRQLLILEKKIQEIVFCTNIAHYKNLRKPLQHLKRVHIDGSFVLVFSVKADTIIFEDFAHHDEIYLR